MFLRVESGSISVGLGRRLSQIVFTLFKKNSFSSVAIFVGLVVYSLSPCFRAVGERDFNQQAFCFTSLQIPFAVVSSPTDLISFSL